MGQQMRSAMVRLAANVNIYQLLALGLALGAVIIGMPGNGGGGG